MLLPKKAKFRRTFRGKIDTTRAGRGTALAFGEYGIKSLESGWLSSRQLEAARKAVTHYTKRGGKLWIRVFPSKPVTKKPPEVRMGGGKGPVDRYVASVRAGQIIFEMTGISKEIAKEALLRASQKIPLKTKTVFEEES